MKMQSTIPTPVTSGSLRFALYTFFAEYPILSAVLIALAHILIAIVLGVVAKALVPQWQPDYVATILMSVAGGLYRTKCLA